MPILDEKDSRKVPARPTVHTFCDRCHRLRDTEQTLTVRGKVWLCAECQRPLLTPAPLGTLSSADVDALSALDTEPDPEPAADEPELGDFPEAMP